MMRGRPRFMDKIPKTKVAAIVLHNHNDMSSMFKYKNKWYEVMHAGYNNIELAYRISKKDVNDFIDEINKGRTFSHVIKGLDNAASVGLRPGTGTVAGWDNKISELCYETDSGSMKPSTLARLIDKNGGGIEGYEIDD